MSHYKSESLLVLLRGQALCHLQCGENRRGSGIIFSYEHANGKWYKFHYAKVMFCIFVQPITCLHVYTHTVYKLYEHISDTPANEELLLMPS